jgi:hypothetical protein
MSFKLAALIYLDAAIKQHRMDRFAETLTDFNARDRAEREQSKLDAYIIADLLDDERETLTDQLGYEDRYGEQGSPCHENTVHALSKAGLVEVVGAFGEIELTSRGRRIARKIVG